MLWLFIRLKDNILNKTIQIKEKDKQFTKNLCNFVKFPGMYKYKLREV